LTRAGALEQVNRVTNMAKKAAGPSIIVLAKIFVKHTHYVTCVTVRKSIVRAHSDGGMPTSRRDGRPVAD